MQTVSFPKFKNIPRFHACYLSQSLLNEIEQLESEGYRFKENDDGYGLDRLKYKLPNGKKWNNFIPDSFNFSIRKRIHDLEFSKEYFKMENRICKKLRSEFSKKYNLGDDSNKYKFDMSIK